MTNQEYMLSLRPKDCYAVMKWVMTQEWYPACCWLKQAVQIGEWQRVRGYMTAGGDSVYKCPHCGGDMHVYGIEHERERRVICDQCGTFNMYPRGR